MDDYSDRSDRVNFLYLENVLTNFIQTFLFSFNEEENINENYSYSLDEKS